MQLALLPSSLFRHLGTSEWDETHTPARIKRLINAEEERSEQLIGWVQLVLVGTFGALYAIAPRPADAPATMLEPVPIAIAAYLAFTVLRIIAARVHFLPGWLLVTSMIVDVAMLYVLIWSFHIQYQQPPAFYLKVPTFAYIFVFIAVRALRFDPRFVLSQGLFAAFGWLLMVLYAIHYSGMEAITRSFTAYLTGNRILVGAEFDKIFTILMVTAILSLALWRARATLLTAVRAGAATREMRRFLSKGVADVITSADEEAMAGMAVDREAAILMLDIRGFTPFANKAEPRAVVEVLTMYHAMILPLVQGNNGMIDKFLGDGVMATFGAVAPSETAAADALRALEDVMDTLEAWHKRLEALGVAPLAINGAVVSGRIVFATIGSEDRLEYTVVGDPANLAAKLEKHNKTEGSVALTTRATFERALAEGFTSRLRTRILEGRTVTGVTEPLDLVVLEADAP